MDEIQTGALIISAVGDFGTQMIIVVGASLGLIVAFLILRKGLYALLHDQSLNIGGFYVRNTPWKGYNRFRSRKWNYNHTLES